MNLKNYPKRIGAKLPMMPIFTTRGCPFGCSFCSVSAFFGKSTRVKPIDHVLQELDATQATEYLFTDDNVCCNPDYSRELFSALEGRDLNWVSQVSSTVMKNPDLLERAARSGCTGMLVGVESLSKTTLKSVRKGFNKVDEYKEMIQCMKKNGIHPCFSFIFGFDEDTEEQFRYTVEFCKEHRVGYSIFWILTPLPGTKLYAESGMLYDQFASSVAISGNFSLVGAPGYGFPEKSNAGAAFVFETSEGGDVVEHKLLPADNAAHDGFGRSIAIAGDVAVVGAPFSEESMNSQNSGSAYVFRYSEGAWELEQEIFADDAEGSDYFGSAVAISGDVILVGTPVNNYDGNDSDDDRGSVYVFRYAAGNWSQEDSFNSPNPAVDDEFGKLIAVSGDVAVVGAPDNDSTTDLGKVYMFRHAAGNWTHEDTLPVPAESATAGAGASFGATFAVSGDSLLVGAFRAYVDDDPEPSRVGTVYAYRYDGVNSWDQEAKLEPSTPSPKYQYLGHFGRSIALSGDTAVIGAKGGYFSGYQAAVHVFWHDGASWVEQDTITTNDPSATDRFAESVDISGTTVLVGCLDCDGRDTNSGAVYLFENVPDAEFMAADGAQWDRFGTSVDISGSTVLVGAR